MSKEFVSEENKRRVIKLEAAEPAQLHSAAAGMGPGAMASLQQTAGNQAVQRLLAQRSSAGAFDLDDDTAGRIQRERGGGQPLDASAQTQMGQAAGVDFSSVRVHTSAESDALNRDLGARAFTSGRDIFFGEGAYQPDSSTGRELIAHELTHVVQQSSGALGSPSSQMHVTAPGDAFEQQADTAAHSLTGASGVQRWPPKEEVQEQAAEEEQKEVQMQPATEEEEEEEETLQRQELEEEEEEV